MRRGRSGEWCGWRHALELTRTMMVWYSSMQTIEEFSTRFCFRYLFCLDVGFLNILLSLVPYLLIYLCNSLTESARGWCLLLAPAP